MEKAELQKICLEKNVLLDASLSKMFISLEEISLVLFLIEKIKLLTGKKFFNESLLEKNGHKIRKFVKEFSEIKKMDSSVILKKMGLDSLKEEGPSKGEAFSSGGVKVVSSFNTEGKKFEVKDFVTHFRNRYEEIKGFLQERKELENLVSINKIPKDRQKFSVIGMIYSKKITKTKRILLEIEDLTGKLRVLINPDSEELAKKCEDIPLDSVLGFRGMGSSEILFANEVIFPEAGLPQRKKSPVDEYAAFIGDVHFGSKKFLEKDFQKMIDYLNGKLPNSPEALKIKYLFIVGDLVTGVGNYPDQEKDLKISDLETQFEKIAEILRGIRKDIKIIISPGNHDGVRLMEPQPLLDERYAWPLYELENAIFIGNPAWVNLGETSNFEGFDVLVYHGFSFPHYANTIPELVSKKAMNQPEKIMEFLLKNRHLAPTHASTQYFPLEKDGLLIRNTPDIFVSGHTHKSGITHFNNVLVVSVSSWEGMTPYQEKFGNKPDHCKVPLVNLKTRAIKIMDFETGEDGIKLYGGKGLEN